jgi:hypothetical protein
VRSCLLLNALCACTVVASVLLMLCMHTVHMDAEQNGCLRDLSLQAITFSLLAGCSVCTNGNINIAFVFSQQAVGIECHEAVGIKIIIWCRKQDKCHYSSFGC